MTFSDTRSFVGLLMMLLLPFTMQAQSSPKVADSEATRIQLNEDFVMSLPESAVLEAAYRLDAAALGMPNATALQRLVAGMSDNLVRFSISADGQSLVLEPQTAYKSDWKVVDWNAYLQDLAPRFKRHKELALRN